VSAHLFDIVDVGARFGVHPSFLPLHEFSRILLIEADVNECNRLSKKYSSSPNILIENKFVNDSAHDDDLETLNIYRHAGGSSAFFPRLEMTYWSHLRPNSAEIVGTQKVRAMSLDKIVGFHLSSVDYLKIDVEGAELVVLAGASQTLKQLIGVRVEVLFNSLYQDQEPSFAAVDVLMRDRGFQLLRYDFPKNAYAPFSRYRGYDSFGALLGGDAIYVRNIDVLLNLSTIKVLKAAVFTALNGSMDLTFYLLSSVSRRDDYFSSQTNHHYLKILERLAAKSIYDNQDLPGQSIHDLAPLWKQIFPSEPLSYGEYFIRFG